VTQPANAAPARTSNDAADDAATRATEADEQRGPQDSRSFEEMIGADTYGAYVEVRRLGTLAQAAELKTAVAGLKLFGDTQTKSVTDLIDFISANYEQLAEARFVVTFMAARPRVPVALSAVEFLTAEDAAAFEPKYRQFVDEQLKIYTASQAPKEATATTSTTATTERRTAVRGGRRLPKPEVKQPAIDFTLRRVGRVLFISPEKSLSLKRLRGEEAAPSLVDSSRFQSARTRFASDSLFVYVDTGVTMHSWSGLAQGEGVEETNKTPTVIAATDAEGEAEIAVVAPMNTPMTADVQPAPEPTAEPSPEEEVEGSAEERKELEVLAAETEENKPSQEEIALSGMQGVMRNLWGGAPRIPGAFALGARLEGGAVVVRLAVENNSDGRVSVIPFLPNFLAGPPVTAEAAEVAPADADVFLTTSLDWEQIYTSTVGAASISPMLMTTIARGDDEGEGGEGSGDVKPPKPEEVVASVEKLFGFKFKEDLIPSLGNEIAFSMPLDPSDVSLGPGRRRAPKKDEKEKESEAGPVVIVTLKDPDKVRKILPRALVALGFVPFAERAPQAERREGFEINSLGGFTYSVIDRFLVMGEDARAVRHVVDSYAARRTLASTDSYRDSTRWQTPQKIVQAFLSDAFMRSTVEETKRRSGDSTDPLVRALLAQMEAPPESASLETTNEGDAVVHEVRVPVALIQTYGLAMMVGYRDAPVITGEMSATYALYEIQTAQTTFKEEKQKGRYGTLEELTAEKIIDKGFAERLGYQIELSASGEKFDVTATPREYGKTGRRSFFLDETGSMRAADHKGKPATAADPPVD
jgi:hypothetical protein